MVDTIIARWVSMMVDGYDDEDESMKWIFTLHKKVKDICQYLDLNTKIKANSWNCTKHPENFKIALTFLCSVYTATTLIWNGKMRWRHIGPQRRCDIHIHIYRWNLHFHTSTHFTHLQYLNHGIVTTMQSIPCRMVFGLYQSFTIPCVITIP